MGVKIEEYEADEFSKIVFEGEIFNEKNLVEQLF
jgi:hypothetical protein